MRMMNKILLSVALICGTLPLVYDSSNYALANEVSYDQTLYQQVKKNIQEYNPTFEISYIGKTKAIDQQLKAIMQMIKESDPYLYENISKWQANYKYTSYRAVVNFTVTYLTNADQERYVDKEIKRLSKEVIKPNMTDIEKIKAIHDYAILNTEYSANTESSHYTIYALLTENKAVCQGYALFMYRMLKENGFEVEYVKGYAGGELHGWVLVKLNDEWYHIDATWNDPLPNRENQVRYKYFLASDSQMMESHTWDQSMYPKATSDKYQFMHPLEVVFVQ